MKDSGVQWIGLIPDDWVIGKVKHYYKLETGFTPDTKRHDYYESTEQLGYDWLTIADLTDDKFIPTTTKSRISQKYIDEYHPKQIPIGSLLYSFKLSVGQVAFTNRPIYSNEAIASFSGIAENLNFLYYSSFLIVENANENIYGAKILNQELIKNALIIYPPLKQQTKIADFLDKKCSGIQAAIDNTKQTIEEYKKLKQAVITKAVTKGIRENRKFKNSGSVWFTDVPEDWETKKLKYVFYIKKDIAGKEGYDVLSITQRGIVVKDLSKNAGQLAADYSNYQLVNVGDFAMNHMDLLTGWVDISKYPGVTSPDYRVFQLQEPENNCARYYLYMMQMCYMDRIFYGLGQGVSGMGRWRLQADKFLNFIIVQPSKEEQQEIADYLDKKCSQIDELISQKEQFITELEKYKQSLIYEYVTGKKEVK